MGIRPEPRNVLGGDLELCCSDPMTGFYRDGYCRTGVDDTGRHTVCIEVTEEFLKFSKAVGNDLSTPMPQYAFPGLKEGDKWCLCMLRCRRRLSTEWHRGPSECDARERLSVISLDDLKAYAVEEL
jgi:uncharacterized protein